MQATYAPPPSATQTTFAPPPPSAAQPSQAQFQPQGIWDDIGSIAQVAVPVILSLLESRPQAPPTAGQSGQFQPQSFWSDLGGVINTGARIGHSLGLFSTQPQGAPPQQAQGQGQFQPQSFWDDISGIAQVAVPVILSLLQSRPQAPPAAAQSGQYQPLNMYSARPQVAPQQIPGQLQPLGFWDDIGSIAQVAVPVILSLLQSRPQTAPATGQRVG